MDFLLTEEVVLHLHAMNTKQFYPEMVVNHDATIGELSPDLIDCNHYLSGSRLGSNRALGTKFILFCFFMELLKVSNVIGDKWRLDFDG